MPPITNRGLKDYLGDGAFAHYDGFNVWLTTEDGISETNTVCLEPEVLRAFIAYVKRHAIVA